MKTITKHFFIVLLSFLFITPQLSSIDGAPQRRKSYSTKSYRSKSFSTHRKSNGGHYKGGKGSSHKGGHYINQRTNNHYTKHK